MLAVLRLGDNAYGVTIGRHIEETAARTVALALVYSTLDRLQDRGLVASSTGTPTPERGGRAKRYFTVTDDGLRQVRDTQRALTALWRGLPQLRSAH